MRKIKDLLNYVSPMKRWGHVGLPMFAQLVRSVCVCAFSPFVCPIHFISVLLSSAFYRAGDQTRDIDPRLFGATLNVGQGPTLTLLWFKASCWYRQHEIPTRAEWILPSTGDADLTFNRHWIGVSLYSVDTPRQHKALFSVEWLLARAGDGGPVLNRLWADVSCLLGIVW